jgi:hypothetical protein
MKGNTLEVLDIDQSNIEPGPKGIRYDDANWIISFVKKECYPRN